MVRMVMMVALGLSATALAGERHTLGEAAPRKGDVVEHETAFSANLSVSVQMPGMTGGEPMVMTLDTSKHRAFRMEVVRPFEHKKGGKVRLRVDTERQQEPQGAEVTSPLEGRSFLVDIGKQKAKEPGAGKLDEAELAELLTLVGDGRTTFTGGKELFEGMGQGDTLAVGDTMDAGLPGLGTGPEGGGATITVERFVDRQGRKVAVLGMLAEASGEAVAAFDNGSIALGGPIEVDVATGWPLGLDIGGEIDLTMMLGEGLGGQANGPVSMRITATYTTADGTFGFVGD